MCFKIKIILSSSGECNRVVDEFDVTQHRCRICRTASVRSSNTAGESVWRRLFSHFSLLLVDKAWPETDAAFSFFSNRTSEVFNGPASCGCTSESSLKWRALASALHLSAFDVRSRWSVCVCVCVDIMHFTVESKTLSVTNSRICNRMQVFSTPKADIYFKSISPAELYKLDHNCQ